LAGEIAPKILARLQAGGFMEAFLGKRRFSGLLQEIPVKVILEPKIGLWGAARLAAQLAKEKLQV
jgi:glucokinase